MIIKEEELTEENLKKISNSINEGRVIAFPTETVYGVGVNGFDEEAIRLLYKVKNRPLDKPISLLVSSIDMIKEVASDITDKEPLRTLCRYGDRHCPTLCGQWRTCK